MKTVKMWVISAVTIALGGSLFAQQQDTASYTFSLKQSVAFALQNSTAIKTAEYDQMQAKEKTQEVMGIALPQVEGSFQVQNFLEIPTSLIPAEVFGGPAGQYIPVQFGTKYNTTASFSASQLLFNGTWLYGLKGAQVYQDLAQKNVTRTQIEASSEVTKAYYTALVNQERKTLLAANQDRLKKIMDDTKALYENGFVEKIDLDRITVTYNNLVTEVNNIQRLLDLSLVILKYQMGMDQSATLVLSDKLADINFTPAEPANGKYNYSNRIEYQLMERNLAGRHLMFKAERIGYLPTVVFFASASAQRQSNEFDIFGRHRWFPVAIVGLGVNMPIFDGLQRHNRVQSAKIGILQAENDLLMMQRTIDMQQAIARVTLQNSTATLGAQKANMELAQSVFDVAQKKYDQGVGSNLEVINAQTSLKEAQTNYFNALYEAVIAKVD
ncbi:MAG TPA: TolC family protein, partial [Bacteroidia bacterium]|nr:TolC family protein [Bacteroidia bacterium]